MKTGKEKYFLLYLKTGAGHLAPAKSIHEYLQLNFLDKIESELVDGLQNQDGTFKYLIEEGYRNLQKGAKWFYEFLYAFYYVPSVTFVNDLILKNVLEPYLEKRILEDKPDKLIIFHFFLISPVHNILKRHNLDIKVLTVVTDPFTAHPFWFKRKDQEFIIFSPELREHLLRLQIPSDKIHVFPFIITKKFESPLPQTKIGELKNSFHYDRDKKGILIFGGGDGIPKGEMILHKLLEAKINANIGIVCGKNDSLLKEAHRLKEKYRAENLHIFGYVDFIYELLNISEIVISKAGASAAMEILSLKKIPVIIDYLWGQEKGNVDFIIANRMGIFERNVDKLPGIVNKLLEDEGFYNSFKTNIENQNIRIGTDEVSRFIVSY